MGYVYLFFLLANGVFGTIFGHDIARNARFSISKDDCSIFGLIVHYLSYCRQLWADVTARHLHIICMHSFFLSDIKQNRFFFIYDH